MSSSGSLNTNLENGGAAQKKSIGEAGGGVRGAMVGNSHRESFESLGGQTPGCRRLTKSKECHLESLVSSLAVPFRNLPQSLQTPAASPTATHFGVQLRIVVCV